MHRKAKDRKLLCMAPNFTSNLLLNGTQVVTSKSPLKPTTQLPHIYHEYTSPVEIKARNLVLLSLHFLFSVYAHVQMHACLVCVCVCVCVCVHEGKHLQKSEEDIRSSEISGSGVAGDYEAPDVSAGNQTWVLS